MACTFLTIATAILIHGLAEVGILQPREILCTAEAASSTSYVPLDGFGYGYHLKAAVLKPVNPFYKA